MFSTKLAESALGFPVERSWKSVVSSMASTVLPTIRRVSWLAGVSDKDLLTQLHLHLPRLSFEALGDPAEIEQEAQRLARVMVHRKQGYEHWARQPKIESLEKRSLYFGVCDAQDARIIQERFHYIAAYHEGIAHFALYAPAAPNVPMAVASLSPMDVSRLEGFFPYVQQKAQAAILSRVFAFDWAPMNTISYLLGQTYRWVRKNLSSVKVLLTFVNPNLGFTGTSLLASNWKPWLEVETKYLYIADRYIPYRVFEGLPDDAKKLVTGSLYGLEPLKVFRYSLQD